MFNPCIYDDEIVVVVENDSSKISRRPGRRTELSCWQNSKESSDVVMIEEEGKVNLYKEEGYYHRKKRRGEERRGERA
jgi:hypothetical protein